MYLVIVQTPARVALAALPELALDSLADVIGALGVNPREVGIAWSGDNPEGNIRTVTFGPGGMVTYLILDRDREVHVLEVQWAG